MASTYLTFPRTVDLASTVSAFEELWPIMWFSPLTYVAAIQRIIDSHLSRFDGFVETDAKDFL